MTAKGTGEDFDDATEVDDPPIPLTKVKWKIILEARKDHVLAIYGPYGGKGKSVAEALDSIAKRLGRK